MGSDLVAVAMDDDLARVDVILEPERVDIRPEATQLYWAEI
jgi:hypothetical protein